MSRLVEVKVDTKDLARIGNWFAKLPPILDSRDIWTRTIRTVGVYMLDAFDSEGRSLTGSGWQPLSQMTRQVRQERGHPADHPILEQTGDLRRVSAETIARWTHGGKGYIKPGKGVTLEASLRPRHFQAVIFGPKVANNYGGFPGGVSGVGGVSAPGFDPTRIGAGFLPARPFFYIDKRANLSMANQMAESIMSQWQSAGGKGVTRLHGRMSNLPMGGSRRQAITTSW